ncbi:MAG: peptidylprolyl isomerase [Clostridia bacterium]
MTKRIWIALMLALMIAVSGLSAALASETLVPVTDEELAAATAQPAQPEAPAQPQEEIAPETVLATLNGEAIAMGDISSAYNYYKQMYESYGMDFSTEENRQALLNFALSYTLQDTLIRQKGAEMGFDQFTKEDLDKLRATADETYEKMVTTYQENYAKPESTPEEKRAEAVAELDNLNYNPDALVESAKANEVFNRVYNSVTEGITTSDADVKAAYDAKLAAAKALYAENPAQYGADLSSGAPTYYTPEGYRTVKHILIAFERAQELVDLNTKLATLKEGDADYATTKATIDEIMAEVQPKVDAVTKRLADGEDFQTLIDVVGQDPGMKAGSAYADTGYALCATTTQFYPAFTSAGMALAKVGDVSEPVLTGAGYHIIRYNSDLPSGEVPFETVQAALRTSVEAETLKKAFSDKLNEWASASVITYSDVLTAKTEAPAAEATEAPAAEATEAPVAEAPEATEAPAA